MENTIPIDVSIPLIGIGAVTFLLSLVFCCYMWKLKRDARQERGFRRICFTPYNKKKNSNDTCPVCLDEFRAKEKVVICHCKHVFHAKCLLQWLQHKNTCPMCKAPVHKLNTDHAFIAQETTRLTLAAQQQQQNRPNQSADRSGTETV